jgi:triosephosphate isomerase
VRKLIAGNWKMNGLKAALAEAAKMAEMVGDGNGADVLICPPFTLIGALAEELDGSAIRVGGQDCHVVESGAHTGDISAHMIADMGGNYCIVGHSERRADHGEDDALVKQKAEAVLRAGLTPIICVGETREEREAGKAGDVVSAQLAGSLPDSGQYVVAYEPVWAIGTGLVPTLEDIAEIHTLVRSKVGSKTRILYGGSVKPSNAEEILTVANVDGALVGGASLKADDFYGIYSAI